MIILTDNDRCSCDAIHQYAVNVLSRVQLVSQAMETGAARDAPNERVRPCRPGELSTASIVRSVEANAPTARTWEFVVNLDERERATVENTLLSARLLCCRPTRCTSIQWQEQMHAMALQVHQAHPNQLQLSNCRFSRCRRSLGAPHALHTSNIAFAECVDINWLLPALIDTGDTLKLA